MAPRHRGQSASQSISSPQGAHFCITIIHCFEGSANTATDIGFHSTPDLRMSYDDAYNCARQRLTDSKTTEHDRIADRSITPILLLRHKSAPIALTVYSQPRSLLGASFISVCLSNVNGGCVAGTKICKGLGGWMMPDRALSWCLARICRYGSAAIRCRDEGASSESAKGIGDEYFDHAVIIRHSASHLPE